MAITYLKTARERTVEADTEVEETVARLLEDIETRGEDAVIEYAADLDGWGDAIVVPETEIAAAGRDLPESVRDDIRFARDRVAGFADRQRESMAEFEVSLGQGVLAGQRLIPVETVGCYVPGGRYAHVASAIMSVTTARAAGVSNIVAASPPRPGGGIDPAIMFALDVCGADAVLALGGVQAIASLAFGLFTGRPADVLAGPGNRFVAEAKRRLYGRVGIDVVAGPTELLVIVDDSADPDIVAVDIAGQVEHGPDSPAWLVSLSEPVATAVLDRLPGVLADLPEPARSAGTTAWADLGEVVLADTPDEAKAFSDRVAPEHLHVQARDLEWWLDNLTSYGSLFLGEQTTVTFGDKVTGPNHILPTRGAARHTGGLSVSKFIKVLTYQRLTAEGSRELGPSAARISRFEGMEGHARSSDIRLAKYFPDGEFDLGAAVPSTEPGDS